MEQVFNLDFKNNGSMDLPADLTLKMVGPKLHGIYVTQCELDYHGSITVDAEILESAGLFPMEFVNIWNKNNGARISTYLLPGKPGSGMCCLNGAAARSCQPGDALIITSERSIPFSSLRDYATTVLTFSESNRIKEKLSYRLQIDRDACRFSLAFPEGE